MWEPHSGLVRIAGRRPGDYVALTRPAARTLSGPSTGVIFHSPMRFGWLWLVNAAPQVPNSPGFVLRQKFSGDAGARSTPQSVIWAACRRPQWLWVSLPGQARSQSWLTNGLLAEGGLLLRGRARCARHEHSSTSRRRRRTAPCEAGRQVARRVLADRASSMQASP